MPMSSQQGVSREGAFEQLSGGFRRCSPEIPLGSVSRELFPRPSVSFQWDEWPNLRDSRLGFVPLCQSGHFIQGHAFVNDSRYIIDWVPRDLQSTDYALRGANSLIWPYGFRQYISNVAMSASSVKDHI